MFDKDVYIRRREQLKKSIGSGVLLFLGNVQSSMNYKDNWYPFRQDSSFLYFFGLDKPDFAALIDIDEDTTFLFGDELSVDDLVWNGPQEPLQEQAAKTGIAVVKPTNALEQSIKTAQSKGQKIHFLPPYRPEQALQLHQLLRLPAVSLQAACSVAFIQAIVAQRSIKTPEEIAEIETAVNFTAGMQLQAIRTARRGLTEAAVAGFVHGKAISAGGQLAFPTILTTNGQILHNHYSNTVLQDGRMVLCDCGAETSRHYAGDLTRTFPVSQTFSTQQRDVYEVVLKAQERAVQALRPGVLFRDVHLLACETLASGLCQLGLMKGDVKEAVAAGAHTLFFQCGLGHMMGLDVHDMENLGEAYVGYTDSLKKSKVFGLKSLRLGKALEAGFVLTVEPGLYFIPELIELWASEKKLDQFINYSAVDAFKDFGGIRIEDDYLITPQGSRILGQPLPKAAAAIETLRQEALSK